MKRNAKRIISVIICVLILLGAAPLNGLAELDFSRIKLPRIDFSSLHLPEIRLPKMNFDFFMTKASAAVVASGTCGDNLTWELTDDGTLTISGTGTMNNYSFSIISGYITTAPWKTYRSDIESVVIGDGVANIGNYAFCGCNGIQSVLIGNSVASIGNWAFRDCTALEELTIPDSVTSIGQLTFSGCSALAEITVPDSVTNIGINAFSSASVVFYSGSATGTWGAGAVYNHYLGDIAFSDSSETTVAYCRKSATNVFIPYGVTSISENAFSGCSELAELTVPDSVVTIGSNAFPASSVVFYSGSASGSPWGAGTNYHYYMGNLAFSDYTFSEVVYCKKTANTVFIPYTVTAIGNGAFDGCSTLSDVYLATDLNNLTIGSSNENLTLSTIHTNVESGTCGDYIAWYITDDGVLTISGTGAMYDYNYTYNYLSPFYYCQNQIQSVVIEEGVESIGEFAFHNCVLFTTISIPASVGSIGNCAFLGCDNLTDASDIVISPYNTRYQIAGNCLIEINIDFESINNKVILGFNNSVIPGDKYIKAIGNYAFANCSGLTSITIPGSVTSIGVCAFEGCNSLSTAYYWGSSSDVTIYSGNDYLTRSIIYALKTANFSQTLRYAIFYDGLMIVEGSGNMTDFNSSLSVPPWYSDRARITRLEIACGVEHIGNNAFSDCTGLTELTIPDSVESVGDTAFQGCTGLTELTIPEGVTSLGIHAFCNCTGLRTVNYNAVNCSVKGVCDYFFNTCWLAGCKNLSTINIGNQVETIPKNAFAKCNRITSVTIPESVTSIGKGAFYNCTDLHVLNYNAINCSVSDSYHGIKFFSFDYWLSNCNSLSTINIGSQVNSIPESAFEGCKNLKSLNVDVSNTVYHSEDNCIIETANKTLVCGCKNSVVPDDGSVTSIGNYAFSGCTGLAEITIPETVTSIGEGSFYQCTGVDTVDIPVSVTSIGENAFYHVKNIKYSDRMTATGSPWGAKAVDAYVEGDFVYEDDSKQLLLACSADASGTVTVPDSVVEVGDNCFSGCDSITSLVFTSDEIVFSDSMVAGCEGLQSISSANTVTSNGVTVTTTTALPQSAPSPAKAPKNAPQDIEIDYENKTGVLFCNRNSSGTYTVPGSISYICENAFAECENVTIDIPSSVILNRIGENAFTNCANYQSWDQTSPFIIGGNLIEAVEDLTEYTLPQTVSCIADSAFSMCASLVSLTKPSGGALKHIGKGSFRGCAVLTNVSISGVESIGAGAFDKSGISSETEAVYLGNCLASVPKNITSFTVGQGAAQQITCMANEVFAGCNLLTSVVIPSSVIKISDAAFSGCTSLESITIQNGVRIIGENVFRDCKSLNDISIPASVENIGSYTFFGCLNLESINVANSNSYYKSSGGVLFNKAGTELIRCPSEFVPPVDEVSGSRNTYKVDSGVNKIGEYAFEHCREIGIIKVEQSVNYGLRNPFAFCSARYNINGNETEIIIKGSTLVSAVSCTEEIYTVPSYIDRIGKYAFAGNKSVRKVVFSSKRPVEISEGAFMGCTRLTEVTIPSTVIEIGECAFENCTNLRSLTFEKNANLKSIGSWAFCNCKLDYNSALFADNGNGLKSKLTNSELTIGEYAFHSHTDWQYGRESSYSTETPNCECMTLRNSRNYLASPVIIRFDPVAPETWQPPTNTVSFESFLKNLFDSLFARLFGLLGLTFR